SFNPRGIDTHFTVVLLDTIRYTCRDLGLVKIQHQQAHMFSIPRQRRHLTDAPRRLSRPVRNSFIFRVDNIVVEESKPIMRFTARFVNKKGVIELATN
ncbi:hypothetical protein PIB30_104456, partial [Stylosanthes scabra]|nr:hypothetical protein [Stylosanthes scabra]